MSATDETTPDRQTPATSGGDPLPGEGDRTPGEGDRVDADEGEPEIAPFAGEDHDDSTAAARSEPHGYGYE